MKKIKFISAITFVLLFSACKKDDNSGSADIINVVQQGSWKITLFNDSGKDETSSYSDYTFTFSGGIVTGSKSNGTANGTYAYKLDDSKHKFILNFTSPSSFSELSDDWQIMEQTSTKIRLEDVSGGNGGTDLLTFEKK